MLIRLSPDLRLLLIPLLAAVLIHGGEIRAQSASAAAMEGVASGGGRLSISLFGGWASFSQKSVNDMIWVDNMNLTIPINDGGLVGLKKGSEQLTDGLTFGIEVRYRLGPEWSIFAGVERLADNSRIDFIFEYESVSHESFFEYTTEGWPIHVGIERSFQFTEKLSYHVGAAAVLFPASKLSLAGSMGSLASIDQEGTATGVGALFSWMGIYDLGGPLSLAGLIRMRLGDVGNATDDAGDNLTDAYSGESLRIDWSGVDILLGIMIDLF